ncbi:MAG: response regulator [Sphingobacteriia bacterium]|nr:response regulator [Sphingobacteriia bacterium]NCC38815.1 response regulator [Gammaproteobacteria bacterium]
MPYLTGFALILILVLVFAVGSLWQAYRDAQEQATTASQNLAQLLSLQLTDLLTHADGVIQAVAYHYQEAVAQEAFDDAQFIAWLNQITKIFTGFQDIRIVDSEGIVSLGSGDIPAFSVADREYFARARDDPDIGLIVAGPLQGKSSKKWMIRLARRLTARDGQFAGIVHVNIEVERLTELFSHLDLGVGGMVVLRTLDLAQVARYPEVSGPENGVGNRKISSQFKARIEHSPHGGHYVATAPLDHVQRVLAYRRLDPYPFYVIVGGSTADILVSLRSSIVQWLAISLVIILGAAVGMWRLYRSARQERMLHLKAQSAEIFEASPLPMLLTEQTGQICLFNQATMQLLGYDAAQLRALSIERLLPALSLDAPCRGADCPFPRGETVVAIRQDGKRLPVDVACTRIWRDGSRHCILVMQDQTERRRMAAALSASEQRYRMAIDAADLGVWTWNLTTGRLDWDQRLFDWYEVPEAIRQQGLDDIFWRSRLHPDDLVEAEAKLSQAVRERGRLDTLYRIQLPDGRVRHIHAVGVVVEDAVTNQAVMIGLNRNITAQREQEAAMRAAMRAAEAANAAKSQFLANMSHEIRTPMNAVLGLAQVLEQGALAADQRDLVSQIRVAGRSLMAIINDILDLSKIEAGQLQLEPRPFALAPLLVHLEALLGPTARAKGLVLEVAPAPTLDGALIGDALRLEQIVTNLVGNAVKFTEHGRIAVRLQVIDADATRVRLRCEVEDTGIGIGPGVIDTLFAPFTQADSGITRRFGGTGLGLSICKRLVEQMGGEIGVSSQVGEGSLFWFELPFAWATAADELALPEIAGRIPRGARLAGLHLLVVDDNALNLDVSERMLVLEGARATKVTDGRQALERLRERPEDFAAVLMDVQMPVMDGLAATRAIRAELGMTRLPVIAVTAGVLREERERARAAGVDDILTKPLELEQLVTTLLRWVRPRVGDILIASTSARGSADAETVVPFIAGIERARAELLAQGDAGVYRRLLRGFLGEALGVDVQVREDLGRGERERERAGARLHRLRGAAANLGALELARAARRLEEAIQADDPSGCDDALITFGEQLASLLEAANRWLTEGTTPQVSPPASAEPLNETKLAALREALGLNQPRRARRLFAELEGGLVRVHGAAEIAEMAEAIARLRFEEALAILECRDRQVE